MKTTACIQVAYSWCWLQAKDRITLSCNYSVPIWASVFFNLFYQFLCLCFASLKGSFTSNLLFNVHSGLCLFGCGAGKRCIIVIMLIPECYLPK